MEDYLKRFEDIDALREPTTFGRRLDASGFVLADPFDTFLTKISREYLQEIWLQLVSVLRQYQINPTDLSWGWLHSGETYIPGLVTDERSPLSYTGWTSIELAEFWREQQFSVLDQKLMKLTPKLRCGSTWRSLKWRIAPTNFDLALRLIGYLCIEEISDWSPNWILENNPNTRNPLSETARAILNEDQSQLDLALRQAKIQYTSIGYRILVTGYTRYIKVAEINTQLRFPQLEL